MQPLAEEQKLTSTLAAYAIILAIAGLQVALAYRQNSMGGHVMEMLGLGFAQAAVAGLFFMRLFHARRAVTLALIVIPAFLLLLMNGIWTDSFRILHLRPWAN